MKIVVSARKEVVVPWSVRIVELADHLDRSGRHAALVLLAIDLAVAADIDPHHSESALTTDAPTPCRPPETL